MNLYYDYTTRPRRRQEGKPSAPPPRPLPAPRPLPPFRLQYSADMQASTYKNLQSKRLQVAFVQGFESDAEKTAAEKGDEKRRKQSGENAMRAECCRSKPRQNVRRRKHPTAKRRSALFFKNAAESKEAFCTLNFFTYGAFLGYNNGNKKIFERSAFQ